MPKRLFFALLMPFMYLMVVIFLLCFRVYISPKLLSDFVFVASPMLPCLKTGYKVVEGQLVQVSNLSPPSFCRKMMEPTLYLYNVSTHQTQKVSYAALQPIFFLPAKKEVIAIEQQASPWFWGVSGLNYYSIKVGSKETGVMLPSELGSFTLTFLGWIDESKTRAVVTRA